MVRVPVLLLLLSASWGFSCFRNPPNSDMDYMICIVRIAYVVILVRANTTRGLGTPTASQHNIFDLDKLTFFSWAPDGV